MPPRTEIENRPAKPDVEKKILPPRKEGSIQLKLIEFIEAVVGEPDPPGG